jgi:hypothetical protein
MPIHDWTRVEAAIFQDFHHGWICALRRALNGGLLPPDYYALIERAVPEAEPMPDIIVPPPEGSPLLHALRDPPRVRFRMSAAAAAYAERRNRIVVGRSGDDGVIARIEVVPPGIKSSRHGLRTFRDQVVEMLHAGIHLLIVDLFPLGPCDFQGIHEAIWDRVSDSDFESPSDKPLTLAAYVGGARLEAYLEPTGVDLPLVEMPLFLTPGVYIPVPLEATYQSAWEAVPSFWRDVLTTPPSR